MPHVASPQSNSVNGAAVAQCPGIATLALAAAGKMGPAEQQAIVQHVGQCSDCASTRNQLTEQLAAWSGRYLYKSHLIWANDWTWVQPYKKHLQPDAANGHPKTRLIDRRFTLIQLAKAVRNVRGATAECGVLGGVGSAMICKTLENTYRDGEYHWGFDSFEGLSEPAEIDRTKFAWQKKGSLAVTPDVALQNLSDFPFCKIVKGWIPDCLAPVSAERFRLVHLDMDLYQPTLDALEFFYPRMNAGGVFVFDDYGHLTCLGVRASIDEFFANKPEPVIETVDGIAFVFKA